MSSTIDELSRRQDTAGYAERRVASSHKKLMDAFVPSSSAPLLSIARHFGLNYSTVLLYADAQRTKTYDNSAHEGDALAAVLIHFEDKADSIKFHDLVMQTIEKRDGETS